MSCSLLILILWMPSAVLAQTRNAAHATRDELTQQSWHAVRDFQDLVECLEVSNHCPKLLTRALLPEAAMEHAMRAVHTDNKVRRWKPHPESEWELLYSCARGQVDWNSPDGMTSMAPFACLLAAAGLLICRLRHASCLLHAVGFASLAASSCYLRPLFYEEAVCQSFWTQLQPACFLFLVLSYIALAGNNLELLDASLFTSHTNEQHHNTLQYFSRL